MTGYVGNIEKQTLKNIYKKIPVEYRPALLGG